MSKGRYVLASQESLRSRGGNPQNLHLESLWLFIIEHTEGSLHCEVYGLTTFVTSSGGSACKCLAYTSLALSLSECRVLRAKRALQKLMAQSKSLERATLMF